MSTIYMGKLIDLRFGQMAIKTGAYSKNVPGVQIVGTAQKK